MKKTYLMILGAMVATSVIAQDPTNMPAIPPPANTAVSIPVTAPAPAAEVAPTNAPAPAKKKKSKKKKASAAKAETEKQAFTEANVTLVPGPAEVSVAHLNVRGQAGLKGEVVTHLQKGDSVTVLSELTLDKHKADEPAQWARIVLPAGNGVWVRSSFIDEATKTVKPKKLNLRGGPGENYSVLGVIDRGTVVNEQAAKGEWSKIEVPTNAYAFIAAMYLKQEASGSLPVNPSPSTETAVAPVTPTPVTVGDSQQINTTPATPEATPPPATPDANVVPPPALNPPVVIQTNIITIIDTNVPPPPPRIVTHEGFVRSSISPVAPTYFELYDPATSMAINYLFSPTTNLDLSRYKGLHINVTGEEGLDTRWKDTPVLSVQKIFVLSPPPTAPAPAATPDTTKKSKPWYHLW